MNTLFQDGQAANTLDRGFDVSRPNEAWAGDITYVWTNEGWLYLSVLLDLFSSRAVGWAMSSRIDQQLTLSALTMALEQRVPDDPLVHHSDRGSQYAVTRYRSVLATHGIDCSMSRRGNCWNNAVAESFFATLKTELVHQADFRARREATAAIFEYIEAFYNRVLRYSYLGYVSPEQYELQHDTLPFAA